MKSISMHKVIILCGGKGSRLKPLTSCMPKPMVPLNGRPILHHIIDFYIDKNFNDFILCTGYRSEVIEGFISESKFDARIEISNQGEEAGILERIYAVKDSISEKTIITYGDTFINVDPLDILAEHSKSKAKATIMAAGIRSPFGLVSFDKDNRVLSYEEKPVFSYYVGNMVVDKSVFDDVDRDLVVMPDGEGLIALFKSLIEEKSLNAYYHAGFNITFNTPQERDRAEEEFTKFFTEQES